MYKIKVEGNIFNFKLNATAGWSSEYCRACQKWRNIIVKKSRRSFKTFSGSDCN